MTRCLAACVALATGLCTTLSVAQANERLLVMPTVENRELNDAIGDRLEVRLHEALRMSDLELIVASRKLARRAMTCAADGCRAELIAASAAEFLLIPEIVFEDEDYRLHLALYDASGASVLQLEDTCSLCGLAEAEDLMADLGARTGRKIGVATRAAAAEILSTPMGASVLVDGVLVGTTPIELPLAVGPHQLRVQLAGYIGVRRSIELVAGESLRLELGLQRPPPKPPIDHRLISGLGWGALAVGAGTLLGGATLIAIDEHPIKSNCAGTNVDANGSCRWRYATLEGGVSLVALGGVLIGTGIALLVARRRTRASSSRVRVRPSLAGYQLEF